MQKVSASGSEAARSLAARRWSTSPVPPSGAIASVFVLIVTMLYFAANPTLYVKGLVTLLPKEKRARAYDVLEKVAHVLRWWFLGQLIDMAVVGVLTVVGLALIGMPMALALGVLAGLLTFVPYFGAILAAVPALAIALGQSLHMAILTAIVFAICHVVEGYVVSPLVQDRMVRLPPRSADPVHDLHRLAVRTHGRHHGDADGSGWPGARLRVLRRRCPEGRERAGCDSPQIADPAGPDGTIVARRR